MKESVLRTLAVESCEAEYRRHHQYIIMNPCLWEPLQIPSGHSVTVMIRAIRKHLQKIHQYALLIQAYRRKEECKTNVWGTKEKRLQYVDAQAERIEIPFFSTTYPSGFLAFLDCSHPIDFVMHATTNVSSFLYWCLP